MTNIKSINENEKGRKWKFMTLSLSLCQSTLLTGAAALSAPLNKLFSFRAPVDWDWIRFEECLWAGRWCTLWKPHRWGRETTMRPEWGWRTFKAWLAPLVALLFASSNSFPPSSPSALWLPSLISPPLPPFGVLSSSVFLLIYVIDYFGVHCWSSVEIDSVW